MARSRTQLDPVIWPGFVDVLSALLLMLFFGIILLAINYLDAATTADDSETQARSLVQENTELKQQLARTSQDLAELTAIIDSVEAQNLLQADALSTSNQETTLVEKVTQLSRTLSELALALEFSKKENERLKAEVVSLGKELNSALATKAQELQGYRSEFFGSLREVLGDNPGFTIVNDRFLIQSEILFASGTATISDAGKEQIRTIAKTLQELAQKFPESIDWLIRVDGHTDNVPISTATYPSNLALSLARAIAVTQLLAEYGIPEKRLVPSGFSSFRPINTEQTASARRQNRRIELRITQY